MNSRRGNGLILFFFFDIEWWVQCSVDLRSFDVVSSWPSYTSRGTITIHKSIKDVVGQGYHYYKLYPNNFLVIFFLKLRKAHLRDRPANDHSKPCFAIRILLRGFYTHQYLLNPNAHALAPCMRS